MSTSQKRAVDNYRKRLGVKGLARFEVVGREGDRSLIRSLAKRLAENSDEATALRTTLMKTVKDADATPRGGILSALRRSPLVDVELDITRRREDGRTVEL